jgi:membrane-anchored protein YejM (alkaline phosphatase superfamily)
MKKLLIVTILLMLTLTSSRAISGTSESLNLLVICIDALRDDQVTPDLMRNLHRFGEDHIRFENVYAAAPWTLPSVASFFTGLQPSECGVMFPGDYLTDEQVVLAEVLHMYGWETVGITANETLSEARGFTQGFSTWIDAEPFPYRTATEMVDLAIENMPGPTDEPWFMYLHFMEPHLPYGSPTTGYTGSRTDIADSLPLSSGEVVDIRDKYAVSCQYMDFEFNRLMEHVAAEGLSQRTVILVYSDHGEEIFDRGNIGHGYSMYEEILHVPVLLKVPAHMMDEVDPCDYYSLTDMVGVMLWGLGFDVSLPIGRRYCFAEAMMRSAHEKKVVVDRDGWKLIWNVDGESELYYLPTDMYELDNRAEREPGEKGRLLEWVLSSMVPWEGNPDAQEIEALRTLGYL